ncbi:MAG: cytochrome P460 family protein [Polyangiaceae bacterium]
MAPITSSLRDPRRSASSRASFFGAALLLTVSGALGVACSSESDSESGEPVVLEPGPGFSADFETSDQFFTRMTSPMEGFPNPPASSPHRIVQIYYSKNIEPIISKSSFDELPEGSVAIKKQDRDEDGTVDQVMVMVKGARGSDPSTRDWVFEQHDPSDYSLVSSSATDAGFKEFCSGCHVNFEKTDWLRGTSLKN